MADRYWVGNSGTWDATSTANWSATSGGAAGASAPTSADNVIIDANSGTGTITLGTGAVCYDLTVTATQAITLGNSGAIGFGCYGSLTFPATGSFNTNCQAGFFANDVNTKTITPNGKSFATTLFNGTGTFVLGSAFASSSNTIFTGTFTLDVSASNYSFTAYGFNNTSQSFGFTFIPRQGTITTSGGGFYGASKTYYNVVFTPNNGGPISGANTFNNLTFAARAAAGLTSVSIGANQTINGTLTAQSGNTDPTKRILFASDVIGTQRTITATTIDIQCADFRDIVGAGTATWSDSTRSKYWGDCLGNSGITFSAGRSVYWNLAGSQNWYANGWAATNNGTPNAQYFPLAQDTATFTEAGAAGTITIGFSFSIGSILMADGVSNRTTAFTLATGSGTPSIYGNVTLFSNLTLTGAGTIAFAGQSRTQTITSAGVNWTQLITIIAPNGTVKTQDALTMASTNLLILTAGTLDLNNTTLTCWWINSNNANTRSIAFGSGNITLIGNNASIWSFNTLTGFSYTGTPTVNLTYAGSTGARTISNGVSAGHTEGNVVSFYVNAGSDIISANTYVKNLIFTGFTGSYSTGGVCYGDLSFASGMVVSSSSNALGLGATTGTQKITTNGQTLDFPLVKTGAGTLQLQDALTLGATRTFTHTAGTVDLNNKTLTCGAFSSSNTNTRSIAFGTGNVTVTGNGVTVWDCATPTNLTCSGSRSVYLTYSGSIGTRTCRNGSGSSPGSAANACDFYITAGSDSVNFVHSNQPMLARSITFQSGFTGTLGWGIYQVINGITLSTGMSCLANIYSDNYPVCPALGTEAIVNLNGVAYNRSLAIGGVGTVLGQTDGGTVKLASDVNLGTGNVYTATLTSGTLDLNGKTLTTSSTGTFSTSNSNVRSINFGSGGIISLPGSGTAFNATNATNLTTSGTGRIDMTSASAKTFAGGSLDYSGITLNQGGAGALTITGANSFYDITNTVSPATVIFPAGVTTTVTNLSLAGTASTDSTATIPSSLSRLTIGGSSINSGREFNGTIKRIAYYPRRLSNATLSSLT